MTVLEAKLKQYKGYMAKYHLALQRQFLLAYKYIRSNQSKQPEHKSSEAQ